MQSFFDDATNTLTYLVWDPKTRDAVVIDPVLDFEPLAWQTSTAQLSRLDIAIAESNLNLLYSLETHAHADHLSGGQYLRDRYGAKVAIGDRIRTVQETFKGLFNLPADFPTDGSQFDELLTAGKTLEAGSLKIGVIATPGHTPACLSFQIEDAVFVGDALFMDDYGTGRCDFPAGSADALYDSVQTLYALPDETRVFVGHDYPPAGRGVKAETTIGKSKTHNPQIKADTSREEFVGFREARDAKLSPPRLIFQSVQVNVNAGRLPKPAKNGVRYLTLPINLFGPSNDVGVPDS